MKRLFLLDGMALVYRAHFALMRNPIRNSKGVNTSALYGFINTLLTILDKENPTHLGVAFDTSAPTPRHVKFPEYKAQREDMPEELAVAIPNVKRLCKAFHIPVLETDGYEADDLIGTLATKAATEGFETYMVTPDKDFAQLIGPHTFMWKPGKQGSEREIIGLEELPAIWGVAKPHQIIDLLGMMGDSADNIPGIPGIGPKTAQKLIARFGSLEEVLANSSELKGKQRENIEANAGIARLSKDLATIIIDAPVETTWEQLELAERDDDAVRDIFNEFEFRSLSKRLFGESVSTSDAGTAAGEAPTSFKTLSDTGHEYRLIQSEEEREQLFKTLEGLDSFCFDIETTSLHRFEAKLLGIAFSWNKGEGWYLPYDPSLDDRLRILFSGNAEKIGHNLKYDLAVLHAHQLPVTGPFFDTMLAHALLHPEAKHSMDYLSETLLGYRPISLAEIAQEPEGDPDDLFSHAAKKGKKEIDVASIPLEKLAEYAAEDADVTWQLTERLKEQFKGSPLSDVYHQIEGPLLPVIVRMEMEGIRMDPDALIQISGRLQSRIDELARSTIDTAGRDFNLKSPKQLGQILFDELKLVEKPKKTKTGQYKTDEQTLQSLSGLHPIIESILEYREATKLKSTYVDSLPDHIEPSTWRVHTHFHQLIAATGRLASTDPNLQNIPIRSKNGREIRRAFVPRKGYTLLSCDYSQVELRVMAALANDSSMIEAFREDRDIHTATAAKVWGVGEGSVTAEQRRGAKMVNFGIIYGISAFGLSQRLHIGRAEAAEIIENYFKQYPAIQQFMERTIETARETGYVETLAGRRRAFPDLQSSNATIRGNAERAAINTPIQGTAADMIKLAMIGVDQLLTARDSASRLLLQIHDELIFDLHPDEATDLVPDIIRTMETAHQLPGDVPLKVDHGTGANWLEAH